MSSANNDPKSEKKEKKKKKKHSKGTEAVAEEVRENPDEEQPLLFDPEVHASRKRKAGEEGGGERKSKKLKKSKTTPDPGRDSKLTPQGRKALVYAYTWYCYPAQWKFMKSRQNWLIRNYWHPEGVPDKYLPFTVKYLGQVHGGAHEKMEKKCQTILEELGEPQQNGDDTSSPGDPEPKTPAQIRRERARALLDALSKTESESKAN